MLASFLIGLREGLEAALVVGILAAYLTRSGRRDVLPRLILGVVFGVLLALVLGAIMTYGAYTLSFQGQEILGGCMSLLAVGMVTWMIFWMQKTSKNLKKQLEGEAERALVSGSLWSIVVIGFVSVSREGVETTLLIWSYVQSFGSAPRALIGTVLGIVAAVVIGWLLQRGMVHIDLRVFFTWTGALLIMVAAGVLAYAIHDLQEANVLPGPWSASATIDQVTGTVGTGAAGFPFGWAFDATNVVHPAGWLASLLQATIGFMPQMTWLQVIAWAIYLAIVIPIFSRKALGAARAAQASRTLPITATAEGRP
ncbi:MAG: FTR1 family protein [Microbacterium sp.]